jgi:hypothetical protein
MKRLILILLTVATATVNGWGQEPPPPGNGPKKTPAERAENMTKRLTKELGLNPEQQVKTKAIILKREQEREKMIKETKENRDKINEEFKTFLTADQFQKLKAREEEMKKKREERQKNQPPPPPAPEGK